MSKETARQLAYMTSVARSCRCSLLCCALWTLPPLTKASPTCGAVIILQRDSCAPEPTEGSLRLYAITDRRWSCFGFRSMARLGPLVPVALLVRLGLLLGLLTGVRGYSSGMVGPACRNMVPDGVGGSPQSGQSPFNVTSNSTTYQDGDTIKGKSRRVTLHWNFT